ncbi:hypothetical protein SB748_19890 [Rhizobium sp. SIMBA_035]
MTKGSSTPEVDWKVVVRSLKGTGTSEGRMLVEKAILEAAGLPFGSARRGGVSSF